MKAVISTFTANRKLSKTVGRTSDRLVELEAELVNCVSKNLDVQLAQFWLVDEPSGYLKLIKKTKSLIEIHCGLDEELSLEPDDDDQFLDYLGACIREVENLF